MYVARLGGNSLERRRQIRFALRAPVHFVWIDRDGVKHKGDGFSRDISSQGVYTCTEWPANLQRDDEVDLDIRLAPSSELHRTLHMRGRSKVIRVERTSADEHGGGFVAESDSFLPTRKKGTQSTVQIKGQAQVIRVDRRKGVALGFAVVSQKFTLYSRGKPVVK
jgi:hypothetical protein